MTAVATAFDSLAPDYDRSFTTTVLGRLLRDAVWARTDHRFVAGQRILELNAGTGADAVHLARRGVAVHATDVSPAMIERARSAAAGAGLDHLVTPETLAIEDLGRLAERAERYDGALSNFGGLNCVTDLEEVAGDLALVVRPGGWVVLCLMGPVVPWEWALAMARGRPRQAVRRFRPAAWRGVTVRYRSPRTVRQAFAPWFVARRTAAVNVLLPPTEADHLVARHPRAAARIGGVERRLAGAPGLAWLADHFLIEMQRR